jgi:hypothetical protein
MCRTLTYLISFVVVLSLVGDVQAVYITWTDADPGDNLWRTPTNWAYNGFNAVPTGDDEALINLLPGPTLANPGAVATRVWVGGGRGSSGIGAMTVDGGTIRVGTSFNVSGGGGSHGTLNMISGKMEIPWFKIGLGSDEGGILNMTGGVIAVASTFQFAGPESVANLEGGELTTDVLQMRQRAGGYGTINVTGGTLVLNGDQLSAVQGYIDNGWIVAYDGSENARLIVDYDRTYGGKTTVKAMWYLVEPKPVDGSDLGAEVTSVELQWTLPEPNQPGGTVTCDVFFGTNPEVTANPKVVDGQAVQAVSVTVAPNAVYYWALDLYDSSISPTEPFHLSPEFTFNTMNLPPIVNAGADVVTWLPEATRTGNLDGTITDDGAYTVQWTVVSEPNVGTAVIGTATAEDTGITLSAVGQYVLQLEAFDGEHTSSDTVTIDVYNDSCEAAQSLPDYEPVVGDLNADCRVDLADMELLLDNWLLDNSLTEEWFIKVD